ncbi:hypothetical protein NBRC116590_17300 [Pelagimonas sp. KU-00592-HH]|uniref:Hint domain-containing protein n=1 Tax=Pelagimonas sp. KU-00592-HH TaxID=3127651 RepID=UPI00310951EE
MFASGTKLLASDECYIPVEKLKIGDCLLSVLSGHAVEITDILSRSVPLPRTSASPQPGANLSSLSPVIVPAGFLDGQRPFEDVVVSPGQVVCTVQNSTGYNRLVENTAKASFGQNPELSEGLHSVEYFALFFEDQYYLSAIGLVVRGYDSRVLTETGDWLRGPEETEPTSVSGFS